MEPLTNQSNNSGSSSESRTPRRKFQRPSSYILRCQKEEGGEPGDAPGQRGTKRILSDEDGSSSEDEAPRLHDANVRSSAVLDSGDNGAVLPRSRGPNPRGRNDDSSDDDYKPDPVDLWSLRQCQLSKTDTRGGPWKWSPGSKGQEQDERQGPGICNAMQDEVLTPAPNRRPEPFDWGSPMPHILQEIEDHTNRQRNVEGCPGPLPWSTDGEGRKSERPYWLPDYPGEKLKECPKCQQWAYGSRCCTLSSDTSSTGLSTGSSHKSRFRYKHLIKR
jgi:hypothetical protein